MILQEHLVFLIWQNMLEKFFKIQEILILKDLEVKKENIIKLKEGLSKKRKEVELFKYFLELKKRGHRLGFQGKWFTDEEVEEFEKIKLKLSSFKKYLIM